MRIVLLITCIFFLANLSYSQWVIQTDKTGTFKNSYWILTNTTDTVSLETMHKKCVNTKDNSEYSYECKLRNNNILDSIDINHDGVKELFLSLEWECTCNEMLLLYNEFGIGVEHNTYILYEVWDIKKKHKVFEFTKFHKSQMATSISVDQSFRLEYEIKIDKKGNIHFTSLNGLLEEKGVFVYDIENGRYIKK